MKPQRNITAFLALAVIAGALKAIWAWWKDARMENFLWWFLPAALALCGGAAAFLYAFGFFD